MKAATFAPDSESHDSATYRRIVSEAKIPKKSAWSRSATPLIRRPHLQRCRGEWIGDRHRGDFLRAPVVG